MRIRGSRILLAILLLGCAAPLFARDVEVTVEDADLGIPLEGAVIRSWDGTEYRCDEAGKARLSVPDDRQGVIRISYPGYENGSLVIPPEGDTFTALLRLEGVMENRELVIEAARPETGETRSGRSVGISDRDLARTAEIGIFEDVMTSIKLLPGVGYTGSFNARPSIRGGEPEDMTAVFDGFYIERPYHWGGVVSIFDPKMVESARLSHGVFSSRYGHTISGLLEVNSKKASEDTELELGVSTSATTVDFSRPLGRQGGIMVMGKVTYWDPFVFLAKQVNAVYENETLDQINNVRVAPYIRSGAFSSHYRFNGDLEWTSSGFFGSDGIGIRSEHTRSHSRFDWDNKLGFWINGITFNPSSAMVIRASLGAGFLRTELDGYSYSESEDEDVKNPGTTVVYPSERISESSNTIMNYQGRADFDWDLGRGLLFAAGVQEMHSQWFFTEEYMMDRIISIPGTGSNPATNIRQRVPFNVDVFNQAFNSSVYSLLEYNAENRRFGTELGLRIDHIYFIGRDFTIQTVPAFNPRLNFDFGVLRDRGVIDALDITVGTGLFSSMNNGVSFIEAGSGIDDFEMKQNRSWTSIIGTRINFTENISFNIEGYFKYVFDRAYIRRELDTSGASTEYHTDFNFDGKGIIGGFDLMLQKFDSRYWDGWLSYSFNVARYKDPKNTTNDNTAGSGWYYPRFHRFHNLNLVLNFKPLKQFHIAARFGLAGGIPINEIGGTYRDDVYLDSGAVIERWSRDEWYSDTARTTVSLPLDLKFSFFTFNKKGKVRSETYLSIENLLSLAYTPRGNPGFNRSTGEEEEDSGSVRYELPIPMLSFGFKWSY
jgi:hypothetical protein